MPSMQPVFAPAAADGAASPRRPAAPAAPSPSAEMGRLLLAGWTMLAESCGECAVPLMREPGSRNELCVSCHRQFRGGEPADPAGAGGSPARRRRASGSAGAVAADGPLAAASGSPARQRGGGSPARSAGRSPLRAAAGSPLRPARAAAPAAAAVPSRAAAAADRSASDRAADLLSERMLQGWALLETACPLCNSPLMRERGAAQAHCVVCDLPVGPPPPPPSSQPPQQQQQQQQQPAAANSAVVPPPAAAVNAAAPLAAAAAAAAAPPSVVDAGCDRPGAAAGSSHTAAAAALGGPPPLPLSVASALSGAQAALAAKLREATALLTSTPLSGGEGGGVEAVRGITALVSDLTAALRQTRLAQS